MNDLEGMLLRLQCAGAIVSAGCGNGAPQHGSWFVLNWHFAAKRAIAVGGSEGGGTREYSGLIPNGIQQGHCHCHCHYRRWREIGIRHLQWKKMCPDD